VILLQINLTFGDEPEIVYEGYYEIEDTQFSHGLQFPTLDTIFGYAV
jgi:hypothetical protein